MFSPPFVTPAKAPNLLLYSKFLVRYSIVRYLWHLNSIFPPCHSCQSVVKLYVLRFMSYVLSLASYVFTGSTAA